MRNGCQWHLHPIIVLLQTIHCHVYPSCPLRVKFSFLAVIHKSCVFLSFGTRSEMEFLVCIFHYRLSKMGHKRLLSDISLQDKKIQSLDFRYEVEGRGHCFVLCLQNVTGIGSGLIWEKRTSIRNNADAAACDASGRAITVIWAASIL